MFDLDEKSSCYMAKGRYEEAYGIVKKQYKLGPSINFAPVLTRYFVSLVHTDRFEKADKIRSELISALTSNNDLSSQDFVKHADNLRMKGSSMESILFYQIASDLLETETLSGDITETAQRCSLGTKLAVTNLLGTQGISKNAIKRFVISHMQKVNDHLSRIKSIPKALLCLVRAICYHHTEQCLLQAGDFKAQESVLLKGVEVLRDGLGSKAEKHELYGAFLNNLGNTYMKINRPRDAARVLNEAVASIKKANYDTELERADCLAKAERALLSAQAMI
ncbi:uncharacterized protein LOC143459256 isoform X2 [Clavelina lepadiformis]